MKKILITGGPVHTKLDSVKMITNRFRGIRMRQLAIEIAAKGNEVYYLSAKHVTSAPSLGVKPILHDGFDDYQRLVLETAPSMDAVVLGAAVANLIPKTPWKDKFPSHDYRPGDEVSIPFLVAPRVIDAVRAVMRPHALLYGFKLLDNVKAAELQRAADGVLRAARADAVFGNLVMNLGEKLVVTPEGGAFILSETSLADWIDRRLNDVYYRSEVLAPTTGISIPINLRHHPLIKYVQPDPSGPIHGAFALRHDSSGGGSFICGARGKRHIDDLVLVHTVDHRNRTVYPERGKASRAAPLFDRIFAENPDVMAVIHTHDSSHSDIPLRVLSYAPPGTGADVDRPVSSSFLIEGHGAFYLLNRDNEVI